MDIPVWFNEFVSPDAHRIAIIKKELEKRALSYKEVALNGDVHLIVYPCNTEKKEDYRLKLLTAHYDRVPHTQGVLDNSCAVWQLMDFASSPVPKENVVIAFTDHEEIPHDGSVREQGAFFLGSALASMGIDTPAVFCFDVTGHGDTILIADTVQQVVQRYDALKPLQHQVSILSKIVSQHFASNHIRALEGFLPFGENLGFMLSGLPALEISMVPYHEAPRRLNAFSGAIVHGDGNTSTPAFWSYLHSMQDTVDLITPEAFFIMQKVLACLGSMHLSKNTLQNT